MSVRDSTRFRRASTSSDLGLAASSGLPLELLKTARKRVAGLSLFVLASTLIGTIALYPLIKEILRASSFQMALVVMMVTLVSGSLILFSLTKIERVSEALLLDLALIYEVLLAFVTAFARHSIPWEEGINRDWSEVAVWIIVFSVVIPNTPGKSFLAALLAALTDPIGLLISVAFGNPMPSVQMLGHLFGPTLFAVVLATILSRLIFRMGKDIQEAKQMGSYQLLEKLGKGGMGEVWLAEHRMLARPAAVKLISRSFLAADSRDSNDTILRRFQREAEATASLESEHTIRLFDFGAATDGSFYYVMEFLSGLNLEELVTRFGPTLPERSVFLLTQVCMALEEAHANGLIHRDIKPANVFVCRKGLLYDFVKVLDFGLVRKTAFDPHRGTKLTMDGRIPGTPAYMAPEVAKGFKVDARTDIYSLGCLAYWMLSGELVFEERDPLQTIMAHVSQEPIPVSKRTELDIPAPFEELILECLAKDPDQRPRNAAEVGRRLTAIALARPWSHDRARRWWQRNVPEMSSPVSRGSGRLNS